LISSPTAISIIRGFFHRILPSNGLEERIATQPLTFIGARLVPGPSLGSPMRDDAPGLLANRHRLKDTLADDVENGDVVIDAVGCEYLAFVPALRLHLENHWAAAFPAFGVLLHSPALAYLPISLIA
jgi:hypothetical protein